MAFATSTPLLYKIFKLRKGEFEKTFLMFLYGFNWVAAFIVGRVLRDTLFLSEAKLLPWLPYMYLLVAAIVPFSLFYSHQIGKIGTRKVNTATLVITILTLALFRYLFFAVEAGSMARLIVIVFLYVFIELMGVMMVINFWTFANELFNSREAKRLFGLIGGGLVLANLYSFPIKKLIPHIGVTNLIFVCIVSIFFCLIIFNHLSKRYRLSTLQRSRIRTRHERDTALAVLVGRSGVFAALRKHIILITIVTMFTVTFLDYQYKVAATQLFSKEDLADFFLSVFAYTGIVACIIQFFITSRLLAKFGILAALLILPIGLLGGSMLALSFFGLWGIILTRGSEFVTRYTITETTTPLLYQPLPPALQRHTKALSDGVVRPIAMALAGGVLIVLNHMFDFSQGTRIVQLSWFILLMAVIWIIVLISARQKFVEALLLSTDHRARKTGLEPVEDESTLAVSRMVVQKALASDDEVQILNAMEVIPLSLWSDWDEHILPLLESPHTSVREEAVRFLGKSDNRKFSRKLSRMFDDKEDSVRAVAIQTYCMLEHERAVPAISSFLNESSPAVKAATITGLIQYGGLEGILSSTAELKTMLDHQDPMERESGAQVLGFIKIRSFYQPLFRLINDPDFTVRRAAIMAAGQMQAEGLIPNLLYMLQSNDARPFAIKALASFKEAVVPQLEEVLLISRASPKIRQAIPMILAQISSPRSYEILEQLLEAKDARLRSTVMRAMQKLFSRMEEEITPNYDKIQHALYVELESYYQLLVHIETVRYCDEGSELLASSLEDRIQETLVRVFYLLSIIYPREQIEIVSYNLRSKNPKMRANAIEIVDNICEPETRRNLLPILEAIDFGEKVSAGRRLYQLEEIPLPDLLGRFLKSNTDEWLIACTIHAIGLAQMVSLKREVAAFADHENPVVREAVLCAMNNLTEGEEFNRLAALFPYERDPVIINYLNFLLYGQTEQANQA